MNYKDLFLTKYYFFYTQIVKKIKLLKKSQKKMCKSKKNDYSVNNYLLFTISHMILKILKVFIIITLFLNASIAIAGELYRYKVKVSPEKVTVWEAVDLTIEAVDKDNNIIKDYEWTVLIFSESDKQADFPKTIEENSYKFSKSDEWSVKFENAVKFSKPWKHDIQVYDLNDQTDSVFWLAEVQVSEETKEEKVDIEILTPPTGTTIWNKNINVSWKSKKKLSNKNSNK